jgi:predicted ATPase/transcriptional regulator with XRE-family HTH domain
MASQEISFGMWMRRRRKALDITQHELAQKVGCSASLIFKIESDERRPSRQVVQLLAQHLEIPVEQHDMFLKVGRQEKMASHLESVPPLSGPDPAPVSQSLKSNLPHALTSFIGREHEVRAIILQLQTPSCRLLNLTGPGGVGKTRLALEVAQQLYNSFDHGACFISLVGTRTSEFVTAAIADALGFSFSGAIELKAQLFNFLKEKQILLVLDNLEHLLNGIELLDELLEFAPGVKLLTTSREQLNLRAEWAFEVQGLPIPSEIELDNLGANNAGALFLQRARQVNMNFVPVQEDAPAIARICQLVEGLPLGLELAATWISTLSCRAIAAEIERGLDFLTTKKRDVPPRHSSIRAVFDHSWSLLTDDQCRVMQQLSVFNGGFTREAAQAVAEATLLTLSALVDKSLVQRSETGRYTLHELIRQYTATILQAKAQEKNIVNRKHAEYYLTWLQACERALTSSQQKDTFAELNSDLDNIRTAWEVAVAHQQISLLRGATWPLYYFYELHDFFQEGEAVFKRGAEMAQGWLAVSERDNAVPERAKLEGALGDLLAHQAFFNLRLGHNELAVTQYRSSIDLLRPLDEAFTLTHALLHYGYQCWIIGDFVEASRSLQEGLPLSSSLQHAWLQANYSIARGVVAHELGDYLEAYRLLHEGLIEAQVIGDPHLMSFSGNLFIRTAQALGRVTEAEDALREGLHLVTEIGDRWGMGLRLERMAVAAQLAGEYAEAHRLFSESIALYGEIGDQWGLSRVLNLRGYFALSTGDRAFARQVFLQAAQIALGAGVNPNVLDALAGLCSCCAQMGQRDRALELAILVLRHSASPQDSKDRVENLRSELETQLTPQQVNAAREKVAGKSLQTVVQEIQIEVVS